MNIFPFAAFALLPAILAVQATADTLTSSTTINSSDQQMAATQPIDGVAVSYPATFTGALDGCEAQIAETMYPRDGDAWGIYEVAADVSCDDGGFGFSTTGSWDGKGFHGAGSITDGSGTGRFADLAGRVAQSGAVTPADGETYDVSYTLMIDPAAGM